MNLYNTRNKIIKLFEDKNIKSRVNTYHAKPKPEPIIESESESESRLESTSELQSSFEESRAGRAKLRRQKIPIKKIKKDKD